MNISARLQKKKGGEKMVAGTNNLVEGRFIIVYGYDGRGRILNLGDYCIEDIGQIHVRIKTGDETGTVIFYDGMMLPFDAGKLRYITKDDGEYDVYGDDIRKWCEYSKKVNAHEGIAYERMNTFIR